MRNITLLVLMLAAAMSAQAELYKWTDKSGGVHYSDQPPVGDVQKVEKKNIGGNVIEGQGNFALADTARKFPVTLYVHDCGDICIKAKDILTKRGIPFAQKNPETSAIDAAALKKLIGTLEVPTMTIGEGTPLKGYLESTWTAALDSAGYPKVNPLAPSAVKAANEKAAAEKLAAEKIVVEKAKAEADKKVADKKEAEEKAANEKPPAK